MKLAKRRGMSRLANDSRVKSKLLAAALFACLLVPLLPTQASAQDRPGDDGVIVVVLICGEDRTTIEMPVCCNLKVTIDPDGKMTCELTVGGSDPQPPARPRVPEWAPTPTIRLR